MISREELIKQFHRIACEVTEKDIPALKESTNIADLGIDSLAVLEIVGTMEREFKVRIPDDQLVGLSTVAQLLDVVQKRIGAA